MEILPLYLHLFIQSREKSIFVLCCVNRDYNSQTTVPWVLPGPVHLVPLAQLVLSISGVSDSLRSDKWINYSNFALSHKLNLI